MGTQEVGRVPAEPGSQPSASAAGASSPIGADPSRAVVAIRETAGEILEWARSAANHGPHAYEAERTNVHIAAALAKLAFKLEGK